MNVMSSKKEMSIISQRSSSRVSRFKLWSVSAGLSEIGSLRRNARLSSSHFVSTTEMSQVRQSKRAYRSRYHRVTLRMARPSRRYRECKWCLEKWSARPPRHREPHVHWSFRLSCRLFSAPEKISRCTAKWSTSESKTTSPPLARIT